MLSSTPLLHLPLNLITCADLRRESTTWDVYAIRGRCAGKMHDCAERPYSHVMHTRLQHCEARARRRRGLFACVDVVFPREDTRVRHSQVSRMEIIERARKKNAGAPASTPGAFSIRFRGQSGFVDSLAKIWSSKMCAQIQAGAGHRADSTNPKGNRSKADEQSKAASCDGVGRGAGARPRKERKAPNHVLQFC